MRDFDYFSPSTAEINPCGCGRRTYWKGGKSSSSSSTSTATSSTVSNLTNTSTVNNSSTSSDTTNTTNNLDKRMVVDGSGIGLSSDSANVTINDVSADNFKALLATTEKLAAQTDATLQKNIDVVSQMSAGIGAAYQDASDKATGNKPILIGGLVVLGLVAVSAYGKSHG
jgi:hypothetical protein